jgi:hypothetical protein
MAGIISFCGTVLSMLPGWKRSAALAALAGEIPH